MKDGKFDCILLSSLLRARQTAKIIADEINYDENIIYDNRLMKLGKGIMAGKHKKIRYPLIKKIDNKFKKKIEIEPILYYQNKHVLDKNLKNYMILKKYCLSNIMLG